MFINFSLLKHPANWAIVALMLIIAGMAGHLILGYLGVVPATADSSS